MATQLEVIQKFMASFDKSKSSGETALDQAISKTFPRDGLKKFQALKDAFMNDLKGASNRSVPHLEGETDVEYFLRVYCGIDFKTKDSGAITGYDAGGLQIKDDDDILLESNNVISTFQDNSFSVKDLNVELADNKAFSDLTATQQFIWQGLYTWWVAASLELIAASYGEKFSFGKKSSATTNKLYVKFINNAKEDKVSVDCTYNETTGAVNGLTLTINTAHYKSLNTTTANSEFDRTIAHEMTHVVMMANMLYLPLYRSLPGFITEGLAELTIGITNSNADKIKALAADVTKYDVGLDANDLARDESFMYEGGYTFFRYLARQAGDLTIANSSTPNTLLLTFYGNDTIQSSANNVTIQSGYGNDSIKASGKKLKINSDGGNNSIYIDENSSNNKITTGSGKDSVYISSNTSNHTVNAGEGNDTVYSGSNVALIDAGDGKDYVYLHLNAVKSTVNAGAGNDEIISGAESVLVTCGEGNDSVSLLSTAKNNTLNGGTGNDYVYIYTGSKNHTINSGEGNDNIHSEGTNILISTGDGDDVVQLYAGDSTAENNTINSGKGNDSIYSGGTNISVNADAGDDYIHVYSYAKDITIKPGAGNDTIESYCENGFLYQYASGDGNDSIKGFSEKDTLNITGGTYSTTTKGNNVIVTVDKSKITLEGAAKLSSLNIGTLSGGSATLNVTNSTKSPVTVNSAAKVINASKRTKAVKITGNALDNTISGGSGKDTLYGGAGNDSLVGNKGNDKLYGEAGNDTLRGRNGNDTLTGGDGKDLFLCGAGKEVITDYETGDRISLASAVTDTAVSGKDVVFTMGKNSLTVKKAKGKSLSMINSAGKSFSTIVGSLTTLKVTNATSSPVTVSSDVEVIDASTRTTAVKITGNKLDNTIYGGAGNDSLVGGNGKDILYGNAGNDTLRGRSGNDTLTGGDGNDLFLCGAGKEVITDYETGDRISLASAVTKTTLSGSDVVFTMDKNSLTVKNAKGKTLSMINSAGKSFSTIVGSTSAKTLIVTDSTSSPVTVDTSIKVIDASSRTVAVSIKGNGSANTIIGGSKGDSLYGRAGNDSIVGNAGNDKLYGSNGNDILVGGAGNDSLWGDAGNDSLYGGAGNDVFIYTANEGTDRIFDYASGDMLRILKSDGSAGGTFSNANFSNGTLNLTIDGGGKVIISNVTTSTTFNVNGNSYTISGSKLTAK